MKKALEVALLVAAVEAIHFIALTGALCGFGFFTLGDGETGVTFKQLLWDGGVAFWFDGFGPAVLLCLFVVAVWAVWEFIADREALEAQRKNLAKEALETGQRLAAQMRPELEATIKRDYERSFEDRHAALAQDEASLAWRYKEHAKEQRALDAGRIELEDQKRKVQAWKLELNSLRRKSERDKERWAQLKRRIRWAEEALAEDPSNVGLARRHLKKAEKE